MARGSKAVLMVYQLTPRVPNLIKQSHLEKKEGLLCLPHLPNLVSN